MEFIFIIAVVILIIWLITSPRSNSNKKKPKVLDNPRQSIKETPDTPASKVSLSRPSSDVTSSINPIKTNKASVSVELQEQMNELKTAKQTDPKPRITVVNTPTSIIESADSATHSEDDLATFNIFESANPLNKSIKGTRKAQWLDKNKETIIQKRKLMGLIYIGEQMESMRSYDPDPALINSILPASTPLGHQLGYYTDDSLGYWPSYSRLSRQCRGAYLDWLATDRSAANTPIGFVFLYFYGFERFVVVNNKDNKVADEQFEDIFNEVLRLHKVFASNRSFAGYSANFLEFMYLLKPEFFKSKKHILPKTRHSLLFKLRLSEQIVATEKVDDELALEWIKNTDQYNLKTAARRCDLEFDSLFKLYYKQKFPEGMQVKPNKTKLNAEYFSASGSLPSVKILLDSLPDPSILKAPIKKLIPIADKVAEELASYSRYLGKAGTSRDDLAALMLLPRAIASSQPSPLIEKFKRWAQAIILENGGVTNVSEFWLQTDLPVPKAINKKESDLIYNLASLADIGIAPDLRYHHAKPRLDGKLVLFTPGHGEEFVPSHVFNQVGVALRLGAMVANIDGVVDESESSELEKLITHDEKLTDTEKRSLKAYLTWRLVTPSDNTGLKNRLNNLGETEIEFVKRFILSIALADGNVDNKEVKQIEKLYTNLGLNKESVTSDIHQLTTSSHQLAPKSQNSSEFSLDETILALHESQTTEAKNMLEKIFTSDEDESDYIEVSELTNEVEGLDQAHSQLFEKLCAKAQWGREEVAQMCSELKLMVDGAIETINDWSFDLVDAPVIDDDGDIYIDEEIVEEIREL
ncbi:TerB N-terminal domain-containing protein [Pseudoalteromonas sp. APC 3355]|uniref:tellurite resistance TerB family protein n=1 Tax=Pseudoalteromonas sp. APC 3355 TaxID=3035199 RepID=UPI0025B51CE5|nr:TerB N-terminal domain-containing protein [Pseudoalteromonas sp. APC 3355]MDN3474068.1 TerB N-terminal domain-containing protein [Pseudoalteromonas sp. APC 3355]